MLSQEAPRTRGHTVDADGLAPDHRVARESLSRNSVERRFQGMATVHAWYALGRT